MRSGIGRLAIVAYAAVIACMHATSSVIAVVAHASASTSSDSLTRLGNAHHQTRDLVSPIYEEYYVNEVEAWLNNRRSQIESSVFLSYDSNGIPYQSREYTYDDFLQSLRAMSVNGVGGGDDSVFFYIGQTDGKGVVHGLVNVAAFLAHAMAISIKYDTCDEFNRDATDGTQKYAISNSCGQWGLSYQDEACTGDSAAMTCDVNPDMTITAASSVGDLPPFQCAPKESASDFTGHWDADAGALSEIFPYANRKGVLHYEGCCWWGRGVLFTRGPCNFGRVNQFLGRKAAEQGYLNFFDVDVCIYPEIICEGEDTRGLRWSVGYFEWADRVETYTNEAEGLDYMAELDNFIETEFLDVNRFIDVVGKALPFGCVETACLAEEEKVRQERRENFVNLVINVLNLPYLVETTPFPTPPPTPKPTSESAPPPSMPTSLYIPPTKPPTKPPTFPPMITQIEPSKQPSKQPTEQPSAAPTGPTSHPTPRPTRPKPPLNVCAGQSATYVAINECKEYFQCANGIPLSKQSCADKLLFDSTINQCNWASVVTCNAPTNSPSRTPTPLPTQQPTKQQLINIDPINSPPQALQPLPYPPTISIPSEINPGEQGPTIGTPSNNSNGQSPTIGKPYNPNQDGRWPTISNPSNINTDGQEEVSYGPTPTYPADDYGLIPIPSAGTLSGIKFGFALTAVLWIALF